MAKWIYLVGTNCADPSREKEFNDWYSNTHQPDLLKRVPGFVSATRYELVKILPPGKSSPGMPTFLEGPEAKDAAKYLAVYEEESDDIEQTLADSRTQSRKLGEEGRMSGLPVIVSRVVYRQMAPPRRKS